MVATFVQFMRGQLTMLDKPLIMPIYHYCTNQSMNLTIFLCILHKLSVDFMDDLTHFQSQFQFQRQ